MVWRMNCEILACWAAPGRSSLQEWEEGILGKRVQVDFLFLRGGRDHGTKPSCAQVCSSGMAAGGDGGLDDARARGALHTHDPQLNPPRARLLLRARPLQVADPSSAIYSMSRRGRRRSGCEGGREIGAGGDLREGDDGLDSRERRSDGRIQRPV